MVKEQWRVQFHKAVTEDLPNPKTFNQSPERSEWKLWIPGCHGVWLDPPSKPPWPEHSEGGVMAGQKSVREPGTAKLWVPKATMGALNLTPDCEKF